MKLQRAGKKTWLSHSGIDILNRCPRCFWLRYKYGIYQPQGIVSRLPVRFDQIIKDYFNQYRILNDLPPIIKGKIEGKLINPFKDVYFYSINQNYGFYGKLDDCLITPEGKYVVLEFKTASSDPRKRKEIFPAYQNQVDEYTFLLEAQQKPTANFAYLIFFYPDFANELHNGVPMVIDVRKVEVNARVVLPRLAKAIKVLQGHMPEPSATCSYCQWHNDLKNVNIKG